MIGLLFSMGTVFSASMPFTDVNSSDPYYDAVLELFNWRIITDDGSHLFHPDDLVTRDFFVWLAVSVGCHKCETPSIEDIIQYRISPFIDLTKANHYYYCISYAQDNNIMMGYPLDKSGNASCEDKKQYSSSPFCPENTITRIEATKILLKQAKLWDDTLNSSNYSKTMSIPDTTPYWYGYAKKWIEMGIITQQTDWKIGQDEKITRKEYAMMTARTLWYTQCQPDNVYNTTAASITIYDENNNITNNINFSKGEQFSIIPLIKDWNWKYNWVIRNPNTWELITKSDTTLSWWNLPDGNWIISLQIVDPTDTTVVSEPHITITIGNPTTDTYNWDIGITGKDGKSSNTDLFSITNPITLTSTRIWGPWDQAWQATNNVWKVVTEKWSTLQWSKLWEGLWTIVLTTLEPWTGKLVDTHTRVIRILPWNIPTNTNIQYISPTITTTSLVSNTWRNTYFKSKIGNSMTWAVYKWDFWDGMIIDGTGSVYHTYTTPWVYTVTLTVVDPISWNIWQSNMIVWVTGNNDTDWDWVLDDSDQCPLVYSTDSVGCPLISIYNPNKVISGTSNNGSLLNTSIWSQWDNFSSNTCLSEKQKTQWLLIGSPNCTQCPCTNSISINSPLRECDIVFPAILSPTLDTVYSRGWLYLIP